MLNRCLSNIFKNEVKSTFTQIINWIYYSVIYSKKIKWKSTNIETKLIFQLPECWGFRFWTHDTHKKILSDQAARLRRFGTQYSLKGVSFISKWNLARYQIHSTGVKEAVHKGRQDSLETFQSPPLFITQKRSEVTKISMTELNHYVFGFHYHDWSVSRFFLVC